MSSCKTLHIRNYIFRSYFVLIPNNEKCSFSVAENELNKLDFGLKLRFLRKIVEGYPICPVYVFSYRRQNNVALLLYFSIVFY
jgi:hypothetical protein